MGADGLVWVKARRSVATNACVEVAAAGDLVALRNSRDPAVVLLFTRAELRAFLGGAVDGDFDHLVDHPVE